MKINSKEEMIEAISAICEYTKKDNGLMMFQCFSPEEGAAFSAATLHEVSDMNFLITTFVENTLNEAGIGDKTSEWLKVLVEVYDGWRCIRDMKEADGIEIDTDELLKQIKEEMGDDD